MLDKYIVSLIKLIPSTNDRILFVVYLESSLRYLIGKTWLKVINWYINARGFIQWDECFQAIQKFYNLVY